MDRSEIADIIKSNYSASQSAKLLNFSEEALVVLVSSCKENKKINLTDQSIDRLSTMEPCRQSGWLANPFMEYMMDRLLASFAMAGPVAVSAAPVDNNTKPDVKPNNKKPEPEPKKPEPEPDDAVPFDLFA